MEKEGDYDMDVEAARLSVTETERGIMKKLIAAFLAVMLVLCLAACGTKPAKPTPTELFRESGSYTAKDGESGAFLYAERRGEGL